MEPLGTATWPVQPRGSGRALWEAAEIQSSPGAAASSPRPDSFPRDFARSTWVICWVARHRAWSAERKMVQTFSRDDCLRRRRSGENISKRATASDRKGSLL